MCCIPCNLPNDLIESLSFHLNEIQGLLSVSFCLERERGKVAGHIGTNKRSHHLSSSHSFADT